MDERITTAGILKQNGHYLIAKRPEGGAVGGLWEFVGGKNRRGESPEETLVREFEEELGITITVGSLITTHHFVNNETTYHLQVYEVAQLDDRPMTLKIHTQSAWVQKDELIHYPLVESDQAILPYLP